MTEPAIAIVGKGQAAKDPLAPLRAGKVAILGTAPDTLPLAPWDDRDWELWGVGGSLARAVRDEGRRCDRWFEIHGLGPDQFIGDHIQPDYHAWLTELAQEHHVYLRSPSDHLPQGVPYPLQDVMERFGGFLGVQRRYVTSTVAWMLLLALRLEAKAVALYGINMAATSEYGLQRSACEYYLGLLEGSGCRVTLPMESDMLQARALYGFEFHNGYAAKLRARRDEMTKRLQAAQQRKAIADHEVQGLQGVLEDLDYHEKNWL